MLLLIKNLTDTLFEQLRTHPQETPELKLNKQVEAFSFSQPINLVEKGKLLLSVTYLEAINSVFKKTDENKSFLFGTPGY